METKFINGERKVGFELAEGTTVWIKPDNVRLYTDIAAQLKLGLKKYLQMRYGVIKKSAAFNNFKVLKIVAK